MKNEFRPNQVEVDALLERLEAVGQGQALFLANLASDDSARRAARQAMIAAARRGGREKELKLAVVRSELPGGWPKGCRAMFPNHSATLSDGDG